jgi:hypothetical protein
MHDTTTPDNALENGRLVCVVLKKPACGDDPRIQGRLLTHDARGFTIRETVGENVLRAYGEKQYFLWDAVHGLHIATREASQRYFASYHHMKKRTPSKSVAA